MTEAFRGVFAIPPTPFRADGELDEPSLRRTVGFCLRASVHGIVAPVNASEFPFLTDAERLRVVEIVCEEAGGRVPVVAGVAGSCLEHGQLFARHARASGAAAVIALPPYVRTATRAEIRVYYEGIAEAAELPVFVQNHLPPIGTPLAPEFVAELVRDIPGVDYVKEECLPAAHLMARERELAGTALRGVMGGVGGRQLFDEYRRGACGTMPSCSMADVHVRLWDRLEAGDWEGAHEVFDAMLPLLNLESVFGVALYKHVLRRRGVIESDLVRQPGTPRPDEIDRVEVDYALRRLEPYFRVDAPILDHAGEATS